VNPNTSTSVTEHLRRELDQVKSPSTELVVLNPSRGPASIESAYDEACAIVPTLECVVEAEREGYDAVVLACFSDPGLEAAREAVAVPVIGMEESALHVACMLGHRFTILTTRRQRVPAKIDHVARLGLSSRLASVRPLDMGVLEMDSHPDEAKARLVDVGRAAAAEDGAEVIVLGCAGLAGYGHELRRALGVAVVDPGPVALKTAELFLELRLTHSKRGLYARPPLEGIQMTAASKIQR
jgi:allantoin racemase